MKYDGKCMCPCHRVIGPDACSHGTYGPCERCDGQVGCIHCKKSKDVVISFEISQRQRSIALPTSDAEFLVADLNQTKYYIEHYSNPNMSLEFGKDWIVEDSDGKSLGQFITFTGAHEFAKKKLRGEL